MVAPGVLEAEAAEGTDDRVDEATAIRIEIENSRHQECSRE